MSADSRHWVASAKRWVVKVGSALLTDDGRGIDEAVIAALVEQLAELRQRGCEVLLVSSGAVAAGLSRLGASERPEELHELQAAAAVGQSALLRRYEEAFASKGLMVAQILLGHDDVFARDRYLNARAALKTLLSHGVVPVINENDTVVTDEIRFGDNDTLAALVANLVDADVLVLLTDQDGLFDADPRKEVGASLIQHARADDPRLDTVAGEGGVLGRGGMVTKLRAARLAARSGTETVIVGGRHPQVLIHLAEGEALGTWLESGSAPENARRQWLASLVTFRGTVVIDDGAVAVLKSSGRSLLPVGVKSVSGDFERGDVLLCRDLQGREVARGLSNYSGKEVRKIMGLSSKNIAETLGYGGEAELIHRDNLVLL
ncbi:glutamate 5-kinase [Congregibacter litoralis]|uniref:Glutamate 5-kinase n=1 Tax=Congregibacter litoralis KT71 TaxID=314285 RepID=A4A643_9GAMM|nr:glutamate 5-kinase [Congregibacter litoralis]EAQ98490.1 glutamate 5-kinase [Congregibacter litoralis KT71]